MDAVEAEQGEGVAGPVYAWLSGRFRNPEHERKFRASFFASRRSGFRFTVLLTMVVFISLFVTYIVSINTKKDGGLMQSGFFGNFRVIGVDLANSAMICTVVATMLVASLAYTPLYNERTQIRVLGLFVFGVLFSFSWPTLGVAAYRILDPSISVFGVGDEDLRVRNALTLPSGNCSAAAELFELVAIRATTLSGVTLIANSIVVFFSTEHLFTLLICVLVSVMQILRAWYNWDYDYGIQPLTLLLIFNLVVTTGTVAGSFFVCRKSREEWLLRERLARTKDARIEQLAKEKERLDYERAFAQQRLASSSPDDDAVEQSLSEPPDQPAAHGTEPSTGGNDVPVGTAIGTASGATGSATGVVAGGAAGACAGGRRFRPSAPLSTGSMDSHTTCSELAGMAAGLMERSLGTAPGGTAPGGRRTDDDVPPLYRLLPQFFHEHDDASRPSETALTWITADEAKRAGMLLRVEPRSGLLLAPGGSAALHSDGDQPQKAIFVLDQAGDFLLTCDYSTHRFHHSSFVAGAAVAAAGEMRIHHGQLLTLSNKSGHYTPCLLYTSPSPRDS